MAVASRDTLIPLFTLLLLLSTTSASALPQDLNLPTHALSSPLRARNDPHDKGPTIHFPPGATAGIVIGVLVIVAVSIFLCCPCWKWTSCRKGRSKTIPSARELEANKNDGSESENGSVSVMQELDTPVSSRPGIGELSEQDAPPRYQEFGRDAAANMNMTLELDSKEAETVVRPENTVVKQELDSSDTMVRPSHEMPASGMAHEMGGGGGEWIVSPLSVVGGGSRRGGDE